MIQKHAHGKGLKNDMNGSFILENNFCLGHDLILPDCLQLVIFPPPEMIDSISGLGEVFRSSPVKIEISPLPE